MSQGGVDPGYRSIITGGIEKGTDNQHRREKECFLHIKIISIVFVNLLNLNS